MLCYIFDQENKAGERETNAIKACYRIKIYQMGFLSIPISSNFSNENHINQI